MWWRMTHLAISPFPHLCRPVPMVFVTTELKNMHSSL
uniref:Uncharacterized protein n=1 Tax=Anguilla anguilla TaxID=7936 RepID=A0A0E9UMJ9_ANGAN